MNSIIAKALSIIFQPRYSITTRDAPRNTCLTSKISRIVFVQQDAPADTVNPASVILPTCRETCYSSSCCRGRGSCIAGWRRSNKRSSQELQCLNMRIWQANFNQKKLNKRVLTRESTSNWPKTPLEMFKIMLILRCSSCSSLAIHEASVQAGGNHGWNARNTEHRDSYNEWLPSTWS